MPVKIEMPASGLIDEVIHIRLTGLTAGQNVTLKAESKDPQGRPWQSQATFAADASGTVDVASQKPLTGTYDEADAMGLFWSMGLPAGVSYGYPFLPQSTPDPLNITFTAEVAGQAVATAHYEQRFMAPGVTRSEIRENGLVGTFFQPATSGRHPAIIVLTGSDGGIGMYTEPEAALFASHGYAALVLAYFGHEGVNPALIEVPLDYFETGIQWLQAQPSVDPDKIAVTGISRGGELVLWLGSYFPQIKAVIAVSASGYGWRGVDFENLRPAWTYKGQPVPHVNGSLTPEYMGEFMATMQSGTPFVGNSMFDVMLAGATNIEEATIPVEKINGAVMILSGTDDEQWNAVALGDVAYKRLQANNFPHPYVHLKYEGAGHFIVPPYTPSTATYFVHPTVGFAASLGGNAKANAKANVDAWSKALQFLKDNLGAQRHGSTD